MKQYERVLIIAAHPDDEVLGCGGIIRQFINQGSIVRVILLGEGSTCRFPLADIDSAQAKTAMQERENAAKAALSFLGVNEHCFYNLPCGRFDQVPIIDIGKIIEAEVREFAPNAVFTHSQSDVNVDHRKTHQATLQALRPGALNLVPFLFSYEVLSSTEWRFTDVFQPNYFFNIEETIDSKIQAMKLYGSELKESPSPRSERGVRTLAEMRGMQVGVKYAEAFRLIRGISL